MHIIRQIAGWTWLLLIILLFSSGCSPWHSTGTSLAVSESGGIYLEEVPFFEQETYQCGPASLAMVLGWSGLEISPAQLADDLYAENLRGTFQHSLIGTAREYGRLAYPIMGLKGLFTELEAGHPVIVLQNLGLKRFPRWHYAVVIGYADNGGTIILHSGTKKAERLSVKLFEYTWSHSGYWGLLVLPAGELPATVTEETYLNGVAGLERTGQFAAAVAGYKSAIERWPKSLTAWMGLGNSHYARGNLSAAADAFEQAFALQPSNGVPLNNLSLVLWEQGEKKRAIRIIRHAIALGGPHKQIFEETLSGFEQQKGKDM